MFRNQFIAKGIGLDKHFRLRGENVSRIEAFSDAVFGFAVTLVVVSLQIPATFNQLQQTLVHGCISFAICFAMLIGVWYAHYKFFRRYGLNDAFTIFLNMVLLFVILLYIYPLKFLFTLLTNSVFAASSPVIQEQQWPLLMVLYGIGFIAVYTVFLVLYIHAYRKRQELELNEIEVNITRSSLLSTLLVIGVGLASVLIAALGGVGYASLAGWIYLVSIPMHYISPFIAQRFWKYTESEKEQRNEKEISV